MKSDLQKIHIQHAFDAYCKTVLVNELKNLKRKAKSKVRTEILMSDLPIGIVENLAVYDDHPWEYTVFNVCGETVLIKNEYLAKALSAIPETQRDIVLMYCFFDKSDREISETLNVSIRTVNSRRHNAYRVLKKLMGGVAD